MPAPWNEAEYEDKRLYRNISIHISDRNHMNLTLNIYNCGNQDLLIEQERVVDHYILYFVNSGNGYVTQKQATHKIEEGQGFVVFPNEPVSIKSEHGKVMNVTWVAFSGYLVDRYLLRAKLTSYEPVFSDTKEGELKGYFETIMARSVSMPNRYCKMMAELYSVMGFLLDHTEREVIHTAATPEMYLMKALDFIDINYHSDISIEDIAESSGTNRKILYTVFKTLTGFSPRDYLIYYRMSKATDLLKDANLSIETVASSVGYNDQFHFSKEFKKNVGVSPSEYRKRIAKDPDCEYQSPIDGVRIQFPVGISTDAAPKF